MIEEIILKEETMSIRAADNNRTIVMGTSRKDLENLLEKTKAPAKVVEELPLIDGFVLEGSGPGLDGFFKSLPNGVTATPDAKLKWIPAIPEEEVYKDPFLRITLNIATATLGMEKVWEKGYTGKGVGVAILDSGIYPHKDYEGRLTFKDFTDPTRDGKPYDAAGHGTHTAGDAAGSGAASKGKFKGPAYEASIMALKIGDYFGPNLSSVIKAIQWVVENREKYNIRVMNLSFGGPSQRTWKDDPMSQAIYKASQAGVVACVAAGNEGPSRGTIESPGYTPSAVTVGALDDKRTVDRSDDMVAQFSSRGPTNEGLTKPDVLAPGVQITAPRDKTSDDYVAFSGTSMASPITAGIIATWFQANPDLTTEQVKEIIAETSQPLERSGATANDQGHGVIDPFGGLQMALKFKEASRKTEAA